jgi:hypothetical protein
MQFKRSQTSIGIRKTTENTNNKNFANADTPNNFNRSATAFDLKRHFAYKSLYTKTSTIYVKKKFKFNSKYEAPATTPIKDVRSPYPHIEGKYH